MKITHLASNVHSEIPCFDYMDFLSASCKKQWRFVDAIYGVLPIFGMVLKSRIAESQSEPERLKDLALQVLSTQVSDETNIVRLIDLAHQQGLTAFDILLPYSLDPKQLAVINQQCQHPAQLSQNNERLNIQFVIQPL